jgi:hypothetical protein
MLVADITEGAVSVLSKRGNKMVRKYRCTSGIKKGRIVAKPATCTTAINVKKSVGLKKTKRRKGRLIGIKSRFAKRNNPTSRRIVRLNKNRLKPTRRSTAKRRSMK